MHMFGPKCGSMPSSAGSQLQHLAGRSTVLHIAVPPLYVSVAPEAARLCTVSTLEYHLTTAFSMPQAQPAWRPNEYRKRCGWCVLSVYTVLRGRHT